MAFIQFDSTIHPVHDLVNAIIAPGASLTPISSSMIFEGAVPIPGPVGGTSPIGLGQTSFYDGSLSLGIGSGILLTSGHGNPPLKNTVPNYSAFQLGNTDSDLQDVADSIGAGEVLDANTLEFQFWIYDPSVQSITFDLVFGSEEFDQFPNYDVSGVFVNGQNVAFFNSNSSQPLSFTSSTLGEFIDNTGGVLPIEYNGVTDVLNITAPVEQGYNTIKFGVGDTRDQIYDSGLFIANLDTSTNPVSYPAITDPAFYPDDLGIDINPQPIILPERENFTPINSNVETGFGTPEEFAIVDSFAATAETVIGI